MKRGLFSWRLNLSLIGIFILTIFFIPITSATFVVGVPNYSIEKIYGPSQDIIGWINISFAGEPLSSPFVSAVGSKVSTTNLSDILETNIGYSYSCSPVDCSVDFSTITGATSKQATLGAEEKIYGIRLTGNVGSINSISFDLESDATESCINQIKVDVFYDGVIDFINNKSTNNVACSLSSGCYVEVEDDSEYDLTGQYCQRINLSESPGFALGAWVKKVGERNVTIGLFDKSLSEIKNCKLPDATTSGGDVSCSINYSVAEPGEYFVCIYPGQGTGTYKIRGHYMGNGCGFNGIHLPSEFNAAYDIFAQGKQFDSPGTLQISNSLPGGSTLADLAENYLNQKYGSLDCSSDCIIPIKIISEANQIITLNNLALIYNQQNVGQLTETKFYDLEIEPAKITSGFGRLYIDQAGFSVPSSLNNYTFSLTFNSQIILSERIGVKDVPIIQSVTPTQAAAGFPQDFIAKISSEYNLTSFSWDFGDGTSKVTTLGNSGNKTTHTYSQIGEYTLRLNVTDQRKLSNVKTFTINVSSPADLIEINLAQLKISLTNINAEIASLDVFSKTAINASLELSTVESSINNLQIRYNNATEEQLSSIVADLLKLRLPETISKTKSSIGLPFISRVDKVNLNALERIGGGTINGNEDEYVNAAAFWAIDNLDTTVDFNEFSGRYGDSLEPITKTFKIKIQEARDISYDYYLIMPMLDGFYSDFQFSDDSGYVYINLKDYNTVSFSTTEDIDFTDLPAFISPAVSRLSLGETTLPEEEKTNKWLIFGLVLLALLVVGVIVYIVLQQWYKRKYENHLFPNRNDLYNMAHYINNAKKKEMTNSNIEGNLKKAGWSAEKIRYSMRKYAGKRTGMLEIPITKIVKKVEEKTKKTKLDSKTHKI